MAVNLLLVTPSPKLGESIRQSLEETGAYHAVLVNNKANAIVRAEEENCRMAFLDLDLGEQRVEDIAQALRMVIPDLQLFILAENETPPALDSIRPWTLVRKPYQIPELLNRFTSSSSSPDTSVDPNAPWLNDVTKAAQHLTRLSLESSSQAALITRNGQLWAYAGQLSQEAANEVTKTLSRAWSGQKGSDLLRFVRLESTKAEHMLYATELIDGVLLAMVFDAETPFSTIRTQASQLVTSLGQNEGSRETQPERPSEAPKELHTDDKPVWPRARTNPAEAVEPDLYELDEDDDGELNIPRISEILTDVPSPNPGGGPEVKRAPDPGETRRSVFTRPSPIREFIVAQDPNELAQTTLSKSQTGEGLDGSGPSKLNTRSAWPARKPSASELAETRLHTPVEAGGQVVLEPASAAMYHLTYACLLVPRMKSHYLTGDIADHLSEWLPGIFISFGWRLEYLAIRPEYLQWVANVPPATSPGHLMRVLRDQTSNKLYKEFPKLRTENPSGEFWAPGYLIMGGTQPHPPQLVKDYVKQIRTRQGIENPRR